MSRAQQLEQDLRQGVALHNQGDTAGAEQVYRRVLKAHPGQVDAMHFLAVIHRDRGAFDEAIAALQSVVTAAPGRAAAHYDLGLAYNARNQRAAAEQHLRRAVELEPNASALNDLGLVLRHGKKEDEAIAAFEAAIAREPGFFEAYINLCNLLRYRGDMSRVLAIAERGIAALPDSGDLHVQKAEALFAAGRLAEAWLEYAWRYRTRYQAMPDRAPNCPPWRGEALTGKKLLVWAEQGIGDVVMYASQIPDLRAMGAAITLRCPPRLTALFRRSFEGVNIEADEGGIGRTSADYQIAIADIARWLRPSLAAFPARPSFLKADPNLRERLRHKYRGADASRFLIGIAWRSTGVQYAADKSIPLDQWGAILSVPNVTFVNLQYGSCSAEIAAAHQGFGVQIVQDSDIDALGDIDGYAAQIAAMDLVITSSNTAAHLAGALGVPTLCLLPATYGLGRRWYWFAEAGSCPWYPALRSIVQKHPGYWVDVIADAAIVAVERAAAGGAAVKAVPYLLGLAGSLEKAKLLQQSEHALEAAERRDPTSIVVLERLAQIKKHLGKYDEAVAVLNRAIAAAPDQASLYNLRGIILMTLDRGDEALASYRAGLKLAPKSVEILNNAGTALQWAGRVDEAAEYYRAGLQLDPVHQALLLNLSAVLEEAGRSDEAEQIQRRLFAVAPNDADGHYNRAQMLLVDGRLAEGWREFQWRWQRPQSNVLPKYFAPPLWDGQPLAGRKVLAYTELGIGDEILIASMIQDLARAADRVCFLCAERLVSLFKRSFPSVTVGVRAKPLPPCARAPDLDFQMSMSELGASLRSTFSDFPQQKSFLVADPTKVEALRARYRALAPGSLVVGVSWASGNPNIGRHKTTDLRAWAPILAVPGVTFIDLQYGDTQIARDIIKQEFGVTIFRDNEVDPTKDMDVPAAQIAAVDLVISVSNTAVHLAGGLGVPAWVMIPEKRGKMWYWFRDRTDSPWYPSLRFFRAADAESWNGLIAQIAAALQRLAGSR